MTNSIVIEQEVKKNLPWNFSVNLIDITFITLGLSLVSRETIMPLLVSKMTDSKIAIGLIPAIYSLGFYLPQLLTASYAERLKWKKPFVVLLGGLGERVPYLLIGIVIWGFASGSATLTLVLFFLLLATTAFTNGVATPAWFTLIGKVLPVNRRGIFFGVSGGLGALMGILGAYFVGQVLDRVTYPNNFAILFGLAFIFTAISWVGLALNREPESPVVKQPVPLTRYLKQLSTILRSNKNYTRYLISYSTSKLGAMAIGFFLVYGDTSFNLSGVQVGTLTGVLIGSEAVLNLIWGSIGDRLGHKVVLTGSALSLALAALVAWQTSGMGGLIATFVLLGGAISADNVSKFNIVLEFAAPEDQPTYIGLTNTLLAPVTTLAPIIGGWLATWAGYQGMFVVAMVIASGGGLLLAFWVRDPRHLQPQTYGGLVKFRQQQQHITQLFSVLRGNAGVIVLTEGVSAVPLQWYQLYLPLYMLALGVSEMQIGWLASALIAMKFISTLLGGYVADRFGRKRVLVTFDILCWGGPMLLYAIAQNPWYFLAGQLINGLVYIVLPSFECLFVEDVPRERRAAVFGTMEFLSAGASLLAPVARLYGRSNGHHFGRSSDYGQRFCFFGRNGYFSPICPERNNYGSRTNGPDRRYAAAGDHPRIR